MIKKEDKATKDKEADSNKASEQKETQKPDNKK